MKIPDPGRADLSTGARSELAAARVEAASEVVAPDLRLKEKREPLSALSDREGRIGTFPVSRKHKAGWLCWARLSEQQNMQVACS